MGGANKDFDKGNAADVAEYRSMMIQRSDTDWNGWDAEVGQIVECRPAVYETGNWQCFMATVVNDIRVHEEDQSRHWMMVVEDAAGQRFVRPRRDCRIVS